MHLISSLVGVLQWRNRLAGRTYKQYHAFLRDERCGGCEFDPHLEQVVILLPHPDMISVITINYGNHIQISEKNLLVTGQLLPDVISSAVDACCVGDFKGEPISFF